MNPPRPYPEKEQSQDQLCHPARDTRRRAISPVNHRPANEFGRRLFFGWKAEGAAIRLPGSLVVDNRGA
jgi:hypothetical protein